MNPMIVSGHAKNCVTNKAAIKPTSPNITVPRTIGNAAENEFLKIPKKFNESGLLKKDALVGIFHISKFM